jgi:hypothetical protein
MNGKKVKINTAIEFIEDLLNIIISRAVNCTHIDLEYLRKEYPGISVYSRG